MKTAESACKTLVVTGLIGLSLICSAQSYPPAWSSGSSYAVGDQVQLNGNVLRAIKAVSPGGFTYADWELWDVRANTTLLIGVGETFATLQSAWNYAQNARITDGASLHLYIDTTHGVFSESFTSAFSLDHGSGAQISVMGDKANNISLKFPSNGTGFTVDTGHVFAALSNIDLSCPGGGGSAIFATGNSVIASITEVTASGFFQGLVADQGANVTCSDSVSFPGSEFPFIAQYNAVLNLAQNITINGNTNGISAEFGGQVLAVRCVVEKTRFAGVYASDNGVVNADECTISSCGMGAEAFRHGYISAVGGSFMHNSIDIDAENGGVLDVATATYTSTSIDPISGEKGSYLITVL